MSLDAYQPCPCGSGKKLKFCCFRIADEMSKATKFQQNNQPKMAMDVVERVQQRHPEAPWPFIVRASILLQENMPSAAKEALARLLEKAPDHNFGMAMYAMATFVAEGFEAAKADIYRAFQRCVGSFPDLVAGLAMRIAAYMHARKCYMAAREHLALAIRNAPEQDREDVFIRLLTFDSDREIPYPLRSVHPLAEIHHDDEAFRQEVTKAERLSELGCWESAAEVFSKLVENYPDEAALWQNIGLCRAWDGDEPGAADALHRAARFHDDWATAVECETVAQLLDLNTSDRQVELVTHEFQISSVAKLLSQLDGHAQFVRQHVSDEQNDEESQGPTPTAGFEIIDRPMPEVPQGESLSFEAIPHVLADLILYDAQNDQPAKVLLTAFQGEPVETALRLLRETGGEEVASPETEQDGSVPVDSEPEEWYRLYFRWSFPQQMPLVVQRRLEQEKWHQLITEEWPRQPLLGLGDQTPMDVAGEPEKTVPLTAAVYVLDAFCDQNGHMLDFGPPCEKLGVEPLGEIAVDENTPLTTFSAMQLHRLPVNQLNDEQLNYALNRAILIHHDAFLYQVLTETLNRPSCTENIDLEQIYSSLVDLCRDQFRLHEALYWTGQCKQYVQKQSENPFEKTLQWELRELMLRLEDPNDPDLPPLLKHLEQTYFGKLPQLKHYVEGLVRVAGIRPPWESGAIVSAESASEAAEAGGIWTPDAAGESSEGSKKLWLPGQ